MQGTMGGESMAFQWVKRFDGEKFIAMSAFSLFAPATVQWPDEILQRSLEEE
jgi:hypothetical protein